MLKIESRKGKISIYLKEKNRFFTKDLFFAFSVAFILHAGFYLLFYISPLKIPSSFLYPPMHVDVKVKNRTSVDSSLEKKAPSLFFEKMQHYLEKQPLLELQKEEPFLAPEIDSLYLTPLESGLLPRWNISLSIPLEWPLIEWNVEGDLKKYALLEKSPLMNKTSLILEKHPFYLSYDVKVDGSQGKIFWWRALHTVQQKEMEHAAEKMLRSLKFQISDRFRIVNGTLYFVLYPSWMEQLYD